MSVLRRGRHGRTQEPGSGTTATGGAAGGVRVPGRHAAPDDVPVVALMFRDGSEVRLPDDDPRTMAFKALARDLLMHR